MITKPRALPDDKIKAIQELHKKFPQRYTFTRLAKMYFVDPNTIRNYTRLELPQDSNLETVENKQSERSIFSGS